MSNYKKTPKKLYKKKKNSLKEKKNNKNHSLNKVPKQHKISRTKMDAK